MVYGVFARLQGKQPGAGDDPARRGAKAMMLTGISAFAFAAALYLALIRLPFLRPLERLSVSWRPAEWPEVVAVIPARNEADTIGMVVNALFLSRYQGALSLVLVDDHSDDGTAERAFEAAAARGGLETQSGEVASGEFSARFADGRQLVIRHARPLPQGWTGKLWAVNAGLEAARRVAPAARYVLLLDADIALAPATLDRLVAHAEKNALALASLMARLDSRGVWGALLIPAFVFFFQMLYPFRRVNNRADPVAAAAGGCMLVRRDALDDIGGVQSIRGRIIDDCALAAAIKRTERPIWLGLAKDEAVSLRDNRAFGSLWDMVARTAFAQLGHSWALLAATVVGMASFFLAAPAIALTAGAHGEAEAAFLAGAAWLLLALAYRPTAALYGQPFWTAFLLPLAAALYTGMTVSSALRYAGGRGGAWKGRTYPA
ncbi:MAG TPA: glycosyl transferase family 2 [Parvularcula sp.]|nr:glycosyl transferase family 2 [Parvularcula sp.]